MANPTLYAWYSAEEAISLFGSPDDAERLCEGQWVIFEKTALCLTTVGEKWDASHFHDASSFYWVAKQPYRVSDGPGAKFLPARVRDGSYQNYWIRLFVRPSHAEKYLYAGELAMGHHLIFKSSDADRGAAHFALKPTLPSKVLAELGGLRLGEMDVAALDEALDRLKQVTTVRDRLDILRQVVNFWHGPIKPEDAMSDVERVGGVPLPLPLQFWYGWAGKRTEVMSGQNILFTPRDYRHRGTILRVEDGRLHFHVENQGVYQWTTLPEGKDPPVFGRYECKGEWVHEKVRLSEHLILTCLFEAIMCHANYGASKTWLDEDSVNAIAQTITPLAIAPWHWLGSTFFARGGAFMCAAVNGEDNGKKYYSVSIGAKTEHPLQFLKPLLDKSWEYVAL
jgi:hypothetical protein